MMKNEGSLTPDGLTTLNAICDEFRRQLKAALLKSNGGAPANTSDVFAAAKKLQQSSWLKQFEGRDSNDADRRAA
jgi:hypothetical protein